MKQNVFHFHLLALLVTISFAGVAYGMATSNIDLDLIKAVSANDIAGARKAVENGANPDAQENSITALMRAAKNGNVPIAKLLIDAGADKDLQNNWGYSALIYTAERNKIHEHSPYYANDHVAKLLLDAGADTTLKDQNGNTALDIAALYNNIPIIELLLKAGVNPYDYANQKNKGNPNLKITFIDRYPLIKKMFAETPMATMIAAQQSGHPLISQLPNEVLAEIEEYTNAPGAYDPKRDISLYLEQQAQQGMATMAAARRNRHPLIGQLPPELLRLIEEYVLPPMNTQKK